MRLFLEEPLLVGGIILVLILVALSIYAAVQEEKEWKAFAEAHSCKLVQHVEGSVTPVSGVVVGTGGNVGVAFGNHVEPDKKAYLCDDGVTYWR